MIIELPSDLSGEELRRRLHVQMVAYALTMCKSKARAAKYLGYSQRWVRQMCQRHDELAKWRVEDPFEARKKAKPEWAARLKQLSY